MSKCSIFLLRNLDINTVSRADTYFLSERLICVQLRCAWSSAPVILNNLIGCISDENRFWKIIVAASLYDF